MNTEPFAEKLERADEILARLMHNYVWHLENRKEQMIKDCARLKSLITEAELLLGVQPNSDIAPPLQQAAVSGSAPTVEFCYRWPDGRIEVRYRREDGTEDCEKMKAEVTNLQVQWGDNCPYFWRIAI